MAISEETTALVAAQLTVAWAGRVGPAIAEDAGTVGPTLLGVYRKFVSELDAEADAAAEISAAAMVEAYRTT